MNGFITELGVILNATLMYTPPLLYAALGSCFSEKSGVVNIGLEGMIIIGAFTAGAFASAIASPWLAFLMAGIAGGIFALLHAFAAVTCKADQTISGTAINFLASGLALFLCQILFNSTETSPALEKMPKPFDGLFEQNSFFDLVFNTYASTYIVFLLVIVAWFVFYKTRFGLRLRAVGEHPRAADTLGVNVTRVRYICVVISGVLAGFGGASIALATVSQFKASIVVGQGFIAIAAVIFGKFKPQGAMLGCLLFGFCNGLRIVLGSDSVIPVNLISMIPYVITVLTLVLSVFFFGKSQAPAANGKPYIKSR